MQALLQRAVALHGRGEVAAAASLYRDILRDQPDHPDALHLLGVTETQQGRAAAGIEFICRSLAVNPDQPVALANQGNALMILERHAEALRCYELAALGWPDYHLARFGHGNALAALGRHAESLTSYDLPLRASPQFTPALSARGSALLRLQRFEEALHSYDRALAQIPGLAPAHAGRGSALLGLGDWAGAARCIDHALALSPACIEALIARGDLTTATGDGAAAVAAYDAALRIRETLPEVWFRRALALSLQGHDSAAAESLSRALALDPSLPFAAGSRLHAQLQVCDWQDHARAAADLVASVARRMPVDFPFSFLAVCDSLELQRRCAGTFASLQPAPQTGFAPVVRRGEGRIRVGYISADFLEHPTAYLMAGLFERHDRRRFEIIGISLREDPGSPLRQRIGNAIERYVVPRGQSDRELARLIRELDLDIAVDLMGYTGEHRAGLFTERVAPVQVNYLGFPGTTAARAMDYIIGDEFLIPPDSSLGYSEEVVWLPDCFQVNDGNRPLALKIPARSDVGLPDDAFVWCSFHSSYKLNPPLFDVWMRLLDAHAGSVLWIKGGAPELVRNLAGEAARRGVEPRRLVFAPPLPYPEHLARLQLADLCLDTVPFNGGATTSDALWSGVPVLTCSGASFAARMSGSLLHSLDLDALIADSLQAYSELASSLCRDRGRLAQLRQRLGERRKTCALFDTDRFRQHLESAFTMMVDRARQGLPPTHLAVPRLQA